MTSQPMSVRSIKTIDRRSGSSSIRRWRDTRRLRHERRVVTLVACIGSGMSEIGRRRNGCSSGARSSSDAYHWRGAVASWKGDIAQTSPTGSSSIGRQDFLTARQQPKLGPHGMARRFSERGRGLMPWTELHSSRRGSRVRIGAFQLFDEIEFANAATRRTCVVGERSKSTNEFTSEDNHLHIGCRRYGRTGGDVRCITTRTWTGMYVSRTVTGTVRRDRGRLCGSRTCSRSPRPRRCPSR